MHLSTVYRLKPKEIIEQNPMLRFHIIFDTVWRKSGHSVFPSRDIVATALRQFSWGHLALVQRNWPFSQIFHAVRGKSRLLVSLSHYRLLLRVLDDMAGDWYAREALSEGWSVRTLARNIAPTRQTSWNWLMLVREHSIRERHSRLQMMGTRRQHRTARQQFPDIFHTVCGKSGIQE